MAVYLIALRESPVRDSGAMAEYQRINREHAGEFSLKPLAVYGAVEVMEGRAADCRIIFVEGL